jgi:hypothetical protein
MRGADRFDLLRDAGTHFAGFGHHHATQHVQAFVIDQFDHADRRMRLTDRAEAGLDLVAHRRVHADQQELFGLRRFDRAHHQWRHHLARIETRRDARDNGAGQFGDAAAGFAEHARAAFVERGQLHGHLLLRLG